MACSPSRRLTDRTYDRMHTFLCKCWHGRRSEQEIVDERFFKRRPPRAVRAQRTSQHAHKPECGGERSLSHPRFAGDRAVPSIAPQLPCAEAKVSAKRVGRGVGKHRQGLRLRQYGMWRKRRESTC
jgi:hypothetical protein